MKNIIYFMTICFLLSNCSVKKKLTFVKINDIKFLLLKSDTIRLQAKAYFKNENNIGGKLSADEIKVIVNAAEIAQISFEEFRIPANKEFSIPLEAAVPVNKIVTNNRGKIPGGIVNSLLNNSLKIQFKGNIQCKILGFSTTYTIDKTKEIKIKL